MHIKHQHYWKTALVEEKGRERRVMEEMESYMAISRITTLTISCSLALKIASIVPFTVTWLLKYRDWGSGN